MRFNFFVLCAFLIFVFTAINCKADSEQNITVKSGETLIISDLQEKQNVHIETGGSLIIDGDGVLKILPEGNMKIDSGSVFIIRKNAKLIIAGSMIAKPQSIFTNVAEYKDEASFIIEKCATVKFYEGAKFINKGRITIRGHLITGYEYE